MNIKVTDKSTGATKVAVRVVKPVWSMSDDELVKALDLKNKIIDYHYEVNKEYQNVDDIEDAADLVNEMLAEYTGLDEDFYDLAEQLLDFVKEDVIAEIFIRDENAREWAEVKREVLR